MFTAGIELFFGLVAGGIILGCVFLVSATVLERAVRPKRPSLFYLVDVTLALFLLPLAVILFAVGSQILALIAGAAAAVELIRSVRGWRVFVSSRA